MIDRQTATELSIVLDDEDDRWYVRVAFSGPMEGELLMSVFPDVQLYDEMRLA